MEAIKIKKDQLFLCAVMIFIFGVLLRLMIGTTVINTVDTFWYKDWALDLPNGLFDVYSRAEEISLDYPPLYLFPLYLIGKIYEIVGADANMYLQMLMLKFFPMLFDVLCAIFLFSKLKKQSMVTAAVISSVWLLNPSMIYNSSVWGQTDSVMMFLLIAAFWYLQEDRPMISSVLFAISCLTKYQCLLFSPAFLLHLYYSNKGRWGRIAKSLGAAAGVLIAVFLPFMLGSKDPMLIFKVYLGGAGTYNYCSLYSFNLYGMLGMDWSYDVLDTDPIFGPVTPQMIGFALIILSVVGLFLLYKFARRRNAWVAGFFIMQCVFMLMTRMHERYQIVVLPFALLAWLSTRKKSFAISYILLTVMTLINQYAVLLCFLREDIYTPWQNVLPAVVWVMSVLNFALFIFTAVITVRYFIKKDPPIDALGEQTTQEVRPNA